MFERKKYLDELISLRNNHLIKVITGARRAGKSFLMNEIFYSYLLSQGIDNKHIIRFAFDNDEDVDKLDNYFKDEPTRIHIKKDEYVVNSKKFRAFIADLINDNEEFIILLDEIQILENFVGTLNSFLYKANIDTYVTGSNSTLLSSDIDTKFNGRSSQIHVYPLTFKELKEGLNLSNDETYKEILVNGGIPLVASMPEKEKAKYLKSLANEIYLKDIIKHNGIKNISDLNDLYSFLASSIGSLVSPTKLVNTFASEKHKNICDDTIRKFIDHFIDSFVVSQVNVFNIKGKKFINSPFKVYFEDLGVRNARISYLGNDEGHLVENLIYNELKYRDFDVYVGQIDYSKRNNSGQILNISSEIDFIASKGSDKFYIQVCLDIKNDETYQREIDAINKINDSFTKILIVKDGLGYRRNENGIIIIDLYDFLMKDNLKAI